MKKIIAIAGNMLGISAKKADTDIGSPMPDKEKETAKAEETKPVPNLADKIKEAYQGADVEDVKKAIQGLLAELDGDDESDSDDSSTSTTETESKADDSDNDMNARFTAFAEHFAEHPGFIVKALKDGLSLETAQAQYKKLGTKPVAFTPAKSSASETEAEIQASFLGNKPAYDAWKNNQEKINNKGK